MSISPFNRCNSHEFVENTFDLPKCEILQGGSTKQYSKYQPSEEFCKYCELVRIPVYKDGEFIEWQIQSPRIF